MVYTSTTVLGPTFGYPSIGGHCCCEVLGGHSVGEHYVNNHTAETVVTETEKMLQSVVKWESLPHWNIVVVGILSYTHTPNQK